MKDELRSILKESLDRETLVEITENYEKYKDIELVDIGIDSLDYVAIISSIDDDIYEKIMELEKITLSEINKML